MSRGAAHRRLGLVLALVAPPGRAAAQWTADIALGARYASPLVRDSIVDPLTVRRSIGAAFTFAVVTPPDQGWSGTAQVDVDLSGLQVDESSGDTDLGMLTTVTLLVGLQRELPNAFTGRVLVGGILYGPPEQSGIFAMGSGGMTAIGGVALSHALPWGAQQRFGAELRYDVHRFLTPSLRAAGFDQGRFVHRVTLSLRRQIGRSR